eukprot:CAMPEP_0177674384 /NCGR_PEP_ID=MMETSP0447-20121125/26522_1 /TAXON_ID=0 /ORGANISM="Stygamoeba regulata, Strain BSH-02190019" /LENGTH=62 /DNA_ID=CAMNT_0019182467 /DNA_START=150 /DNA_END=335 /DNA_ORIENTATION=-
MTTTFFRCVSRFSRSNRATGSLSMPLASESCSRSGVISTSPPAERIGGHPRVRGRVWTGACT